MGREYQISLLVDLSDQDKAFLKASRPVSIELGGSWGGITIPPRQERVRDNLLLWVALPRSTPAQAIKTLSLAWPEAITMRLRGALWGAREQGYRNQISPGATRYPQPR